MSKPLNAGDTYNSPANKALLSLIDWHEVQHVLDLGAGSGSNLCFIKTLNPTIEAIGVTCSEQEANLQRANGLISAIANLDGQETSDSQQPAADSSQDVVILSHVIEHLSNPAKALALTRKLLKPGGRALIAVPNIANWRFRLKLAAGKFNYEDAGTMDKSHLRFYTHHSIANECRKQLPEFECLIHSGNGGLMLGPLRSLIPKKITQRMDNLAVRTVPNLIAYESFLVLKKPD
jgi:SAM-dependent methyltransferase